MKLLRSLVRSITDLTLFEKILWSTSAAVVLISFFASHQLDWLVLAATLVGISALIFTARGDVLGQILIIIFSTLYAIVSFRFSYYGEMISYIFMSGGIAFFSTISWIRHPYAERQVKISRPKKSAILAVAIITVPITWAFYYILKFLGTASLFFSTISIATSFVASALTFLRSPFYALAYCCNDIVLIILWIFAAIKDPSSIPMIPCFFMFLVNDAYGFINWLRMEKKQQSKIK